MVSRIAGQMAGILAVVAFIIGLLVFAYTTGKKSAEVDAAVDTIDRTQEGQDAAREESDATRDLDDDAVRERLRNRDW